MDNEVLVDEEMEPDPRLNRITNAIIGAAIDVHRVLGPGHLESVYQKAMGIELELRGIPFQRQLDIELVYKGITGHPLGLLINFNVAALRQGIKRIAGRRRNNQ